MSEKAEWVEIIEPVTKSIMFANIKTGECVWESPIEETVLTINEQAINSGTITHQWWELFDVKSSRFYYFNDRTAETSWQKPKDKNIIILPLSKFQLGQTGELRTKTASSPKVTSDKTNQIKLTSNGEVILKKDNSTQTNLTNKVCFNASTQTAQFDEDENKDQTSFSFSSYVDQFEQMTNRSSRSNKSNLSGKSSNSNCFDTNCTKSNCRSLKHYLLNEAKFAGVYDDRQYWKQNQDQESLDEDDLDSRKRFLMNKNRFMDDSLCVNSGDSSSTDLDADDEDANDSDYANQDQESVDEDEDFDEELNDDEDNFASNDNLNDDSSYSGDDLADYFSNDDNLGLATKVRLQRMLSAQVDKKKRLSKHKFKDKFGQFDDDEFYDDDEEVLNSLNSFINKSSKKDPNDYLETSSFIFLNKSATFDSTDDLNQTKPMPMKRISSMKRNNGVDQFDDHQLPDHQAIKNQCENKNSLNGNRMSILPNSIADKAEIIDPTRNLRDTLVNVSDLLKKELPRKPKKEAKKEIKKKEKEDKNKPKPPKRDNSLDSSTTDSLNKPIKSKDKKSIKNEELEKFAKENIKRHLKKGGLNQVFKRKESLKGMLVWTKSSIKQPMIATILNDNELKQVAINCFQSIQIYCGDRETKSNEQVSRTSTHNENLNLSGSLTNDALIDGSQRNSKEIAFKLIDCAITRGTNMKDEIFVQLCRQTTENPNEESLQSGLVLMTVCLYYFTASNKFAPYLYSFLSNHRSEFARNVCLRKFKKKMELSCGGSSNYCRRPLDSTEVQMVIEAINRRVPGIFGESLEELMNSQTKRWPDRKLPWILVTLSETILRLGGNEQEGIFRIAGDVEEMNFVKLYLDCLDYERYAENCDFIDIMNSWKYCSSLNRGQKGELDVPIDVHSIACILKQWFRELPTPIMPYELYKECLEYCDDAQRSTEIIEHKLPQLNKLIFGYLIRFLQVFCAKQNVELTKMDDSNISMIWAPNLVRASKQNQPTDPSEIFDNTRREMSFIRCLIQNLNTSFIQGII